MKCCCYTIQHHIILYHISHGSNSSSHYLCFQLRMTVTQITPTRRPTWRARLAKMTITTTQSATLKRWAFPLPLIGLSLDNGRRACTPVLHKPVRLFRVLKTSAATPGPASPLIAVVPCNLWNGCPTSTSLPTSPPAL